MNSSVLGWVLSLPLLGGVLAVGLWLLSRRKGVSAQFAFWSDAAALALICAGLMAGPVLLLMPGMDLPLSMLGLTFQVSPILRAILPFANAALLAAVFFSWDDSPEESTPRVRPVWVVWAAVIVAPLVAGALTVSDRTLQALFMFAIALITAAAALSNSDTSKVESTGASARISLGGRLAGGLKHIAIAAIATVLFVAGATLVDRYGLSLEKRSLLQLGVSLLSVGLLVRVGAMPFAGAASDLLRATPGAAIIMLGAAAPAMLGAGLQMLSPIEGSLISAPQTAWIAALGVLLAGIRTLGVSIQGPPGKASVEVSLRVTIPILAAMSVAVQVGWALFGVLSGSRMGATGAILLAANMALAVPLLVIGCRIEDASQSNKQKEGNEGIDNPQSDLAPGEDTGTQSQISRLALAVAVASLLGLPPVGGFAGTLMVAQAATNISGVWLALLLLGTLLLGASWVRAGIMQGNAGRIANLRSLLRVTPVLLIVLIATQLALFALSGKLAAALGNWPNIPWLFTP